MVGLLVVGVELAIVRARHRILVGRVVRVEAVEVDDVVARDAAGVDAEVDVVGLAGEIDRAFGHLMHRDLEALAVGAGAADARCGAVRDRRDPDRLGVVGALLGLRGDGHVAHGREREVKAALRAVPVGGRDLVPGGALDALRGFDRGRAGGGIGVHKDRDGGADGQPDLLGRGVLHRGGDLAVAGLDGVDADVDHVVREGNALVGVGAIVVARDAHSRKVIRGLSVKPFLGEIRVAVVRVVEVNQLLAAIRRVFVGVGAVVVARDAAGQDGRDDGVELLHGVGRSRDNDVALGSEVPHLAVVGVHVRVFLRALARARHLVGQRLAKVKLVLAVGGRSHRNAAVAVDRAVVAIAAVFVDRDALGQVKLDHRLEVADGSARVRVDDVVVVLVLGVLRRRGKGRGGVVIVGIVDAFGELVEEVSGPGAVFLQGEHVLRNLDLVEGGRVLGLRDHGRKILDGAGRCGGLAFRVGGHGHRRGGVGVDVHAVDAQRGATVARGGQRAERREREGEDVAVRVRLAVVVREPAAAREVLDDADLRLAVGLVVADVAHREGDAILERRAARRAAVGRDLKEHVAVVVGHDHAALAVGFRPNLDDAVEVLVAVGVVRRLLLEGVGKGSARGTGREVDHGAIDGHPTLGLVAVGLEVHAELVADRVAVGILHQVGLVHGPLRRAEQLDGHGLGGRAVPDLLRADRRVLGVGEARLRDEVERGDDACRGGVGVVGLNLGREAIAHALSRKHDLEVERAVALVDDHDARVVGRRVVSQLIAVVKLGALRDDLGGAVLKDVVLVAGGHERAVGVLELVGLGRAREVRDVEGIGRELGHDRVRTRVVHALARCVAHARVDRVARGDKGVYRLLRREVGQHAHGLGFAVGIEDDDVIGGVDVEGRVADRALDEEEVGVVRPRIGSGIGVERE